MTSNASFLKKENPTPKKKKKKKRVGKGESKPCLSDLEPKKGEKLGSYKNCLLELKAGGKKKRKSTIRKGKSRL